MEAQIKDSRWGFLEKLLSIPPLVTNKELLLLLKALKHPESVKIIKSSVKNALIYLNVGEFSLLHNKNVYSHALI